MWPGTGPDDRRKKAMQSLDELLTLHEDDEEGWFWRAQLAGQDGPNATAVFYKALLRVNPLHPGANHEFVHFFENIKRPALGWPYAEGYVKSSPGIPHAHHMQAHLGTRIGKWGVTSDWSWKAIELQVAYHKLQGVTPGEDHQFNHHMDILTRSLVHDGRFAEAKQIKAMAEGHKYTFRAEWLRMAIGQRDWEEAQKQVEQFRRTDKSNGAYYAALVSLEKGDTDQAGREIDTLRQASQTRKLDKGLERRLWEVQGRLMCQKGDGEAGLKLLKKLVDATKNDFYHHAWGNGAVYMESWGVGRAGGRERDRRGGGVPGGAGPRRRERPRGAGHVGGVRAAGPRRGGRPLPEAGAPRLGEGRPEGLRRAASGHGEAGGQDRQVRRDGGLTALAFEPRSGGRW